MAACVLLLVVSVAVGCGREAADDERYVPPSERAQRALRHVLEAWRSGEQPGLRTLEGGEEVYVVDSQWQQGRRLRAFELLGEAPGDGPRTLAARLELEGPRQEAIVRYYLVGIQPLWIFRQEDYDMISHWDHAHGPPPTEAEPDQEP
jgi:hypothetical protein